MATEIEKQIEDLNERVTKIERFIAALNAGYGALRNGKTAEEAIAAAEKYVGAKDGEKNHQG